LDNPKKFATPCFHPLSPFLQVSLLRLPAAGSETSGLKRFKAKKEKQESRQFKAHLFPVLKKISLNALPGCAIQSVNKVFRYKLSSLFQIKSLKNRIYRPLPAAGLQRGE
jgi:hypothetical protein